MVLAACAPGNGATGTGPAPGDTSIATSSLPVAPSTKPRPPDGAPVTTGPPSTTSGPTSASETPSEVEYVVAEVVATHPHDPGAFTQGLVLDGGVLYESTGRYGESTLRQVDVESGEVVRQVDLADDRFGEGLALVGDRLVQLTWQAGEAYVYDVESLELAEQWAYDGEGWGLCEDDGELWMSDGSSTLTRRDASTFATTAKVEVTRSGEPVDRLNELECVGGRVYANVWMTDEIVVIDPRSGAVVEVIDASGLLPAGDRTGLGPDAVLNGIAHDPSDGTFLLTGKLWPHLFRVRLGRAP